MKAVKIALKVLIWIVAIVVVAVLALPLWLGPVVTTTANAVVPGIVKTDFRLGHLSLNPYTARFELGDLRLANPAGYSEKYAVTVGDVAFDAKTFSLLSDVIHVEEIKVKDVFVSYLSGGPGNVNNFRQIQYNVAGGKEKFEAAQSAKEAQAASVQDNPAPVQGQEPDAEKPAKKFIIDRLEISGIVVQLGFLPIRIPMALVMTDIGLSTGGASASEIGQAIWNDILKQAGVVGDQLKVFGIDAANRTSRQAGKLVTGTTSRATKTVNATVGTATEAVNGGVKAVSEGAKKAVDSLKGLW